MAFKLIRLQFHDEMYDGAVKRFDDKVSQYRKKNQNWTIGSKLEREVSEVIQTYLAIKLSRQTTGTFEICCGTFWPGNTSLKPRKKCRSSTNTPQKEQLSVNCLITH